MHYNLAMPRIERLWIKPAQGAAMVPAEELTIVGGDGVAGNKQQQRHVTLISAERWAEIMSEMGADLDPGTRRANVLISDIDLNESTGRTVRIGEVELHIRGETKPCHQMDAALDGLKNAMVPRWGGGAWADAVTGGTIRVGDDIKFD